MSPAFRDLPLDKFGLQWLRPPVAVAHPLDGIPAGIGLQDVQRTIDALGTDGPAYQRLVNSHSSPALLDSLLQPLTQAARHPVVLARFGLAGLQSATSYAGRHFHTEQARALFAGLAAHSVRPLDTLTTAAFGVVFSASVHVTGWPFAAGGSQSLADALAAYARSLGVSFELGWRVRRLDELPSARAYLFDTSPREMSRIVGDRLPAGYRRRLNRFAYGPGVFKVDYALDGPIPWTDAHCSGAGTVHVGGTLAEVAAAERDVARGRHPSRPFVLVTQPSVVDPSRAPKGRQVAWAYCHVPLGSRRDVTAELERQIERFAPGFRDRVLARHVSRPTDLEAHNANLVGGDITGGSQTPLQLLFRPVPTLNPYRTPVPSVYLCSASTPPGGGVHGMCGLHAARTALRELRGS
jgi:phytoene dehydrogenase-like protein